MNKNHVSIQLVFLQMLKVTQSEVRLMLAHDSDRHGCTTPGRFVQLRDKVGVSKQSDESITWNLVKARGLLFSDGRT